MCDFYYIRLEGRPSLPSSLHCGHIHDLHILRHWRACSRPHTFVRSRVCLLINATPPWKTEPSKSFSEWGWKWLLTYLFSILILDDMLDREFPSGLQSPARHLWLHVCSHSQDTALLGHAEGKANDSLNPKQCIFHKLPWFLKRWAIITSYERIWEEWPLYTKHNFLPWLPTCLQAVYNVRFLFHRANVRSYSKPPVLNSEHPKVQMATFKGDQCMPHPHRKWA